MWLDAGDKDWQLPALTAPASCNCHPKRLKGLLFYCDVFLFTGQTLGHVLATKQHKLYVNKKELVLCVNLISTFCQTLFYITNGKTKVLSLLCGCWCVARVRAQDLE